MGEIYPEETKNWLQDGINKFLAEIYESHSDKTVLIVTHEDAITAVRRALGEIDLERSDKNLIPVA